LVEKPVGEVVHYTSGERRFGQPVKGFHKDAGNSEEDPDEGKRDSRPGSGAQYHVRAAGPKDAESFVKIHEEQPVTLRVPNEQGLANHVIWDGYAIVENIEVVVFFIGCFQRSNLGKVTPTG